MEKELEKYHTHISAKHNWMDMKLKELWKYRDLVWLFTKRSFVLTYKQTVLGPAWIFISPFLTSIIYTFVFGNVAGMSTDGVPKILFYLSSNAIWNLFSRCFSNNSQIFRSNANVFGKVYFPRLVAPISNIISNIIRFGIQMLMTICVLVYYVVIGEVQPNWSVLVLIPLIVIQLSLMGMGCGMIISSMTTKYRDLSILVSFGISLLMYATPVVYPISQVSDGLARMFLIYNPVTMPIEIFRYALLGQGTIVLTSVIFSGIFTVVVMFIGMVIFNRVERTFVDTV